ncbi:hypothetical protein Zmor_010994 [Zophobas morio]|uniref:V-type proton ATPase subunit F n=1 Tax=Zophobas morio TaxID=2755281 RepID=A0AA38IPX4_9CUCU|nr:hypothetical protein Zmor_010994 [Zophobas morio]
MKTKDLEDPNRKPASQEKILRHPTLAVPNRLMAVIGDEDTCVGFLMVGVGDYDKQNRPNFLVVKKDTDIQVIKACFMNFIKRKDIAIILICQYIADMIRSVVDAHEEAVPAVLEIPSRDHPYDSEKDCIIKRAMKLIHK